MEYTTIETSFSKLSESIILPARFDSTVIHKIIRKANIFILVSIVYLLPSVAKCSLKVMKSFLKLPHMMTSYLMSDVPENAEMHMKILMLRCHESSFCIQLCMNQHGEK